MNALAVAMAACVPVYATRELTARQLCCLLLLQDGPVRATVIGEALYLTKGNTHRLLAGMRKRLFVEPVTPGMGRNHMVELTPRGQMILRKAKRYQDHPDGVVKLPFESLPATYANVARLRAMAKAMEQRLDARQA